MPKYRFFLAFLALAAATGAQADSFMVAEFRADDRVDERAETYTGTGPGAGQEFYDPGNLYYEEIRSSEEKSWSVGDYKLSGVMDWGQRANYLAGRHYGDEQFISLGSKFSFGQNDETHLYYGLDYGRLDQASEYYGGPGDAETTRTGLSQTLYFADQRARIGVGYEYASGDRENVYEGLEGHEINISGRVRLGWGFNAHLEAGYGLYSYNEYDGVRGDLNSARTNMRAEISQSFTPSLRWGMHYSYVDQEFDASDLTQSRRTWGLNLEYRY